MMRDFKAANAESIRFLLHHHIISQVLNVQCWASRYVRCVTVDVNECDSSPCQNGGTCLDDVNGYSCSCAAPYAGTHCSCKTLFA